MRDSLGDRMKRNYENITRLKLYRRTPVIIRLDGKAFHTLTRKCKKPFDQNFINTMIDATLPLFDSVGGNLKIAYIQSDEISLLLTDWDRLMTEAYFDYNIQKLVSTIASEVSVGFSHYYGEKAVFDARAFNIPKEEVCNYFIWRQQDWERNSIQMLAQSKFPHKQLQNKNHSDIHEMLHGIGINWADLSNHLKRGICLYPVSIGVATDRDIPIFTEDRNFIEKHLKETT